MSVITASRNTVPLLALLVVFSGCHSPAPGSSYPGQRQFSPVPTNPCPDAGVSAYDALPCSTEDPTEASVTIGISGLWTNMNPIGVQVPAGALRRADDIEIDAEGKAWPRRNQDALAAAAPLAGPALEAFEYAGTLLAWDGATLNTATLGSGSVTYSSRGAVASIGDLTIRHATGGGDLYVTSPEGPLVLDGVAATLKVPSVPAPLGTDPIVGAGGAYPIGDAAGWFADGDAAAYRYVIGYNDTEGRPVLSEPSPRAVVVNTSGGPAYVSYRWQIPDGLTTSHFIQMFRTRSVPDGAEPGDTMYQVLERPLTSGEIAIGYFQEDDIVPDTLLGTPLYTNPDRGGVASANVRPPLAQDLAAFRDRMWLANTTAPQRLQIRFIATPVIGTVYYIAGMTITAWGSESDYATGNFEVVGSGTTSQNIDNTVRNFVAAINAHPSNPGITARIVSGTYDPPGMVLLEQSAVGGAAFTARASPGDNIIPVLASDVYSRADTYPNRLHYSRPGLHYAFPLSSTLQVGAEEHGIVRIAALRDALFAFKGQGGDGLWKVTGAGPFYVEQVNASVQLLSPDAVAVVNNTIFAGTDKGVIAVTEAGVETISVPIEDKMAAAVLDGRMAHARFIAREANTEQKLYVGLPSASDLTGPMVEAYVYNLNTSTWVHDTREWSAGVVRSGGSLVLFDAGTNGGAFLERNTGNRAADSAGVDFAIAWNTETANFPADAKQFVRATVLFEEPQASSVDAEVWFTADDGEEGPAVLTGGEGEPYIRAEVPFDQQRTSRLGVELRMPATQGHTILGLDVRYKVASGIVGVTGR